MNNTGQIIPYQSRRNNRKTTPSANIKSAAGNTKPQKARKENISGDIHSDNLAPAIIVPAGTRKKVSITNRDLPFLPTYLFDWLKRNCFSSFVR